MYLICKLERRTQDNGCLQVPTLVAQGRLPLTEDNRTEPIPIPGFKFPVHPSDLVTELKDPEYIKFGAYDSFLRMSRRVHEAPIVLVNTFRELEEDVFDAFDDLFSQAATDQQVSIPKSDMISKMMLMILVLPSHFQPVILSMSKDHSIQSFVEFDL